MVRNRLCQTRNVQRAPRPFSRNRNACEKHLSLCAISTCPRQFPKHDFPSVEAFGLRGCDRLHVSTRGFSKSFGGGLAQIRATQACDSERRAWSSAEELIGADAPSQAQSINALPLSARFFARGEGGGRGASSPQASELLHLTAF